MGVQQAPRKRVAGDRKKGVVVEWKGTFGFIKPSKPIKHPEAQKNNGKIYVHSKDMRAGITAGKDMKVEFFVYTDGRGLGAEDVTKVGGASKGAVGVEKLPPGWKKMFSEEENDHYYWNAATKESSWVRPGGDANSDDDEADAALPLGWSKEWSAEQNEWYYWNKLARTASWEKPKAKVGMKRARPAPTPAEEDEEETRPVVAPRADGPILGQQRMSGIVTQWEGVFGWIAPLMANVPADLKALLARSQDKVYVNWREVKDGLKLKVGSHVDFNIFADDNGLGASDVSAHQPGRSGGDAAGEKAVQKLQKEWANQDGKKAKFARTPAAKPKNYGLSEASAGDDVDGDLLPGWEQCWSEEHHMNFYWHKASKSSSWERPAVPDDGDSNSTSPAPPMRKPSPAEERRAMPKVATPLTPLISKAGRSMTPNTPTFAAVRTGQGQSTKRARTA